MYFPIRPIKIIALKMLRIFWLQLQNPYTMNHLFPPITSNNVTFFPTICYNNSVKCYYHIFSDFIVQLTTKLVELNS